MKRHAAMVGVPIILLFAGMLGYRFHDWQESVGDRLRRQCASILEAAGQPSRADGRDVIWMLERTPALAAAVRASRAAERAAAHEANYRRDGWTRPPPPDAYDTEHPAWHAAEAEAYAEKREQMIRSCVVERGLGRRRNAS